MSYGQWTLGIPIVVACCLSAGMPAIGVGVYKAGKHIRPNPGEENGCMNPVTTHMLMTVTHLGAATTILPVLPAIWFGLWMERRHTVVVAWSTTLFIGALVTLISKLAFIGWGLGVASLDFTGVSGHTLLATAILPVVFSLLPLSRPWSALAFILGLCLVVLVGWSRVVLGAHSWSEVVAGWCLGALISGSVLVLMRLSMRNHPVLPGMRWLIATSLLVMSVFSQSIAETLPVQPLVVDLALKLSGHEHPFNRTDLHRLAGN